MLNKSKIERIGVVGLGYVGLPLALELGKKFKVIGFDISESRIKFLSDGIDLNDESTEDLKSFGKSITFSSLIHDLVDCDIFIVTVPTPVNDANQPDFGPLLSASKLVGSIMKRGSLVIYESTVYPGATEELCVPALESSSTLKWLVDFNVGYSPERINPGDVSRPITAITKVVSGDTVDSLERVASVYGEVISAGIFRASCIKVAEAAKVIENTQRDLNIALMNEVSIIFRKIGIPTAEVLEAASTKWNFLRFKPGLVGGHCIGVDPYYLTYKAESLGYKPEVILAGRKINDSVAKFYAEVFVKNLMSNGKNSAGSRILVLGYTFKENCADTRNTKVADLIRELLEYGMNVKCHDPLVKTPPVGYGEIFFGKYACQ